VTQTPDDTTLGGYLRVHQRPPAFGGPDGLAYSVGVLVDDAPDADGRYGACLLFVRWSPAGDSPDGHVETRWLAFGASPTEAKRALQALTLQEVKDHLDHAVQARRQVGDW
jgi:hypothetical protein